MLYSTNNIWVSLNVLFAEMLLDNGFDVRWWASDTLESNYVDPYAPRAEVTLVRKFPANQANIVRLKGGGLDSEDEVVIPAFSLYVASQPQKIARAGIGESVFLRSRRVRLEGLAANEDQHILLGDLVSDWIDSDDVEFQISDYDTDPSAPPPIVDKVWVADAVVAVGEFPMRPQNFRYQIVAEWEIRYFE